MPKNKKQRLTPPHARRLAARIRDFARSMTDQQHTQGLFSVLEIACGEVTANERRLHAMLERASRFRRDLALASSFLGIRRGV